MAKFQVGSGIDNYIQQLGNLANDAPEAIAEAIYEGAKIITDEVNKNIRSLPGSRVSNVERQGLLDGLGIAPIREENGYWNVKVGFDGYNKNVTKNYPKGKANAMIARSLEHGTSWLPKTPFVSNAVKAKAAEAEQKMAEIVDEYVKESMK